MKVVLVQMLEQKPSTIISDSNAILLAESNEVIGPSLQQVLAIRKTSQNKPVLSYQRPRHSKLKTPISFLNKNYELVLKKYSTHNKKVKDVLEIALNKECGELNFAEYEGILSFEITDRVLFRLFITSVYVINNYFGTPGPRCENPTSLYMYVHKLIPLSKNNQNLLYDIAKEITPPQYHINLLLIEAAGCKSVGSSNYLFCKVWLNSEPKWVEMTDMIPGKANPVWNAKFFFHAKDLKSDFVTIELYQTEKSNMCAAGSSSTASSVTMFFHKYSSKSSDRDGKNKFDCLGKVVININDLYSEGVNKWIPLERTENESENISIHIEATFSVQLLEKRAEAIKRHVLLLRYYIEDEIKCLNSLIKGIKNWDDIFSRPAFTLVFLHSVISALIPTEDILSKFVVLSFLGRKWDSIPVRLLHDLLNQVLGLFKEYPEEVVEIKLSVMFQNEAREFFEYCLEYISFVHSHKLFKNVRKKLKFELVLKSIYLCEDVIAVTAAPLMMLKSDTISWLDAKAERFTQLISDNRAIYAIEFLDSILRNQKVIDEVVQNVIPGETLTKFVYKEMDEKLSEPLKKYVTETSRFFLKFKDLQGKDIMIREGIELFTKIREFVTYLSETTKVPVSEFKLSKFREWFGKPVVIEWFEWSRIKAEKEITEAVKQDNLEIDENTQLEQETKTSTSAKQTCDIIQNTVANLWKVVSITRAQKCDELLMINMHSCYRKYADLMIELVDSRKLLDEFHDSERRSLCVITNNMHFVAKNVEKIILQTIEKLPPVLCYCKLSIEDSCEKIFSYITDKFIAELKPLLDNILEGKQMSKDKDALALYVTCIKKHVLKDPFREMLPKGFIMYLKTMVKQLIKLFKEYMDNCENVCKNGEVREYLQSLAKVLSVTKETCSILESSEENESIWNEEYTNFASELDKKIKENS